MKITGRFSNVIQTHNAVSVGTGLWSSSSWFPCDGFDKVAVTMLNSAATNSTIELHWSIDGTTQHGKESLLAANTDQTRAAISDVKAPFCQVSINNGNTSSNTMSAWAYLKA